MRTWQCYLRMGFASGTRAADHCASKLLGVVAVDCAHLPPAGPLGLHTDSGEPVLLGQDRMCNGEPSCEGAGLFQIDGEAEHHAAVHIDDDGQRRPLDRLPVLLAASMIFSTVVASRVVPRSERS